VRRNGVCQPGGGVPVSPSPVRPVAPHRRGAGRSRRRSPALRLTAFAAPRQPASNAAKSRPWTPDGDPLPSTGTRRRQRRRRPSSRSMRTGGLARAAAVIALGQRTNACCQPA